MNELEILKAMDTREWLHEELARKMKVHPDQMLTELRRMRRARLVTSSLFHSERESHTAWRAA